MPRLRGGRLAAAQGRLRGAAGLIVAPNRGAQVTKFPSAAVAILFGCLVAAAVEAKTDGQPRDRVSMVIVHAIGGPTCRYETVRFTPAGGNAEVWKEYLEAHEEYGIHYVIGRDGAVAESIPEMQIANHAPGHNDHAIGIELVNRGDGKDPYPRAQVESLIALLRDIMARHRLGVDSVKRHSDVDTRTFECGGRTVKTKQDPGPALDWIDLLSKL
jgi:N-acetylmuramoyl-L-alanine amidase